MRDTEHIDRPGLPPREHNADVPEHASNGALWMGLIAMCAVLGLLMFGTSRTDDTIASNPVLNMQPGTTTGAAPAAPSKRVQ